MNGLLYVAGGQVVLANTTEEITNSVLVYDPRSDTWRSVAPMHFAREKPRLVHSGRYLYAIGGVDPTGRSLASMERYDPVSDSWQFMKSMHESRWVTCAVATKVGHRNVLVVVGGRQAIDFTPVSGGRTTEVFDIATGKWTLLGVLLPRSRSGHDCAVEAHGAVLAIRGATTSGTNRVYLRDVDALSLTPKDIG